jgi:hypothetical protein
MTSNLVYECIYKIIVRIQIFKIKRAAQFCLNENSRIGSI